MRKPIQAPSSQGPGRPAPSDKIIPLQPSLTTSVQAENTAANAGTGRLISFAQAKRIYDKCRAQRNPTTLELMSLALLCLSNNCLTMSMASGPEIVAVSAANAAPEELESSAADKLEIVPVKIDTESLIRKPVLAQKVKWFYDVLFPLGLHEVQFFDDSLNVDMCMSERSIDWLQDNPAIHAQLRNVLDQIVILSS